MNRVAIIGGGITGLTAAYRLNQLSPRIEVDLFEQASSLGGVLITEEKAPFLFEHSADMFTTMEPSALELCREVGLEDELIGTNQQFQRAFIAQGSELIPVPKGLNLMTPSDLDAIQQTALLSHEGKKRFLSEESVPAAQNDDESLESFATRRFGDEAYRKIIQPLVGGIYTADPKLLSLKATLPQYLRMESQHGSIISAARHQAKVTKKVSEGTTSGARYNLFVAPRRGMGSMIEAIRNQLTQTSIRNQVTVQQVERDAKGKWLVDTVQDGCSVYDAVILTIPADSAMKLLGTEFAEITKLLETIQFASSAIVVHGFSRADINHALDGFGFVVPLSEKRNILAGSFSSVKFSGRSSDDTVLTRTFIGGGCQPELLDNPDDRLAEMARDELGELLGISGNPMLEKVVRWNRSMPQYHLGHLDRVSDLESALDEIAGLEIVGKSYRGVGIPACVKEANAAAKRVVAELS